MVFQPNLCLFCRSLLSLCHKTSYKSCSRIESHPRTLQQNCPMNTTQKKKGCVGVAYVVEIEHPVSHQPEGD